MYAAAGVSLMSRIKSSRKDKKRGESFFSGAVKLTAAGFIVRMMGFVNRIFMSNLIGAEGMGLYQLTFPVYSLIILTLTSGVSITVSGMTAKCKAKGDIRESRTAAKVGFGVLLIAGTACGVLMAVFAKPLAQYVLGDSRTALSMVLLSPCIPIVASASALKGYFYGMSEVTPTAISQIVEQVVRIGFIFALAGVIAGQNLENACAIITMSSAVGEMANLLVVFIAFKGAKRRTRRAAGGAPVRSLREKISLFNVSAKKVVKDSLPISAGRFIVSIMGTVESVLLPMRFLAGGMDYTASLSMLGRLSGMAMPLIMFPSVVTSALATTLVPAIASAVSVNNLKLARSRISRCIKMSLIMGFLFFGIFFTFGGPVGELLYPGQHVGELLCEMSVFCILLYLQQTMTGILNGLEKQTVSLVSTVIGSVVRLASIWFLVPQIGVNGYIIGMLFGTSLTCVINLAYIVKCMRMPFLFTEWIVLPCLPAAAMMLVGGALTGIFNAVNENIFAFCGAAAVSVAVWFAVMLCTRQLSIKNLKLRFTGSRRSCESA